MTLMEKLKLATTLKKMSTMLKEAKMGNKDTNTTVAGLVVAGGIILNMFGIDVNADVFDLIKTYIPSLKNGLPLSKALQAVGVVVMGWYIGKKGNNKA